MKRVLLFLVLFAGLAGAQTNVQGAGASGSATAENPVLVGGSDGTNRRTVAVDSGGRHVLAGTPAPALASTTSIQTSLTGSNTGAASAANVTLAGVAAKTTYIAGFQVTGGGATAASIITVTVTGVITGTMSYNIAVPAGATLGITPLIVTFPIPVPASAVNTAIVVNVPSFGTGNTASAVAAQGFQQ